MAGVLQAHRHVGDAGIAIMNLITEYGFRQGSERVQQVQEFMNVRKVLIALDLSHLEPFFLEPFAP